MFATPSLVSIFYSCCIAFNSQLVFIFHRQPWAHILPYYILAPLTVTCIISKSPYSELEGRSVNILVSSIHCSWYRKFRFRPNLGLLLVFNAKCTLISGSPSHHLHILPPNASRHTLSHHRHHFDILRCFLQTLLAS